MNVLGSMPPPTTAVDMCLDDGFALDSGLKIGGAGVLLAAGEVFAWRPWTTNATGEATRLRNAKGQFHIQDQAWAILDLLWPKPDLLILGTGPTIAPLSPETRQRLNEMGIRVEVQDTRNAAAQFNLLATERGVQQIAAALSTNPHKANFTFILTPLSMRLLAALEDSAGSLAASGLNFEQSKRRSIPAPERHSTEGPTCYFFPRSLYPSTIPTLPYLTAMSNPPGHPNRNLQPTVSTGSYAASSMSQMALPSDQLHIPQYPQYGYAPQDTSFQFPAHPQTYRQHPPLKMPDYAQPGAPQHLQHDLSLPGSSSSNASAFQGLMAGPGQDLDVGVGASQHSMTSPIIKKGRTNTPWTPAEEQRLKTLREAGRSWSEIAKTFPTRTEGSVKKHWYKDMHYAEFAEDEVSLFEAALLQAIKDYESSKWKVIGQKVGKPAKACEQFAKDKGWKV
ncbi:hypothetical protein AMS68_004291 [Peltaster fructicola]|uniref:Uncharacterized protein n=1 Tax=Peltaster fructicola TaxID=286661 RepID=A0A6H0XVM0_9PEZI|nr:hypothetical protein AMS68_004291 [Peltaster fructicola]